MLTPKKELDFNGRPKTVKLQNKKTQSKFFRIWQWFLRYDIMTTTETITTTMTKNR